MCSNIHWIIYAHDWLTLRNYDVSYCVIFVYELKCGCLVQLDTGLVLLTLKGNWVCIRFWHCDVISSAVLNIDECSLCQGTSYCSVLCTRFQLFHTDTNMCDRLFDAFLLFPSWTALGPMIVLEDLIEELMWYMRVVHLDHMASPAKPCSKVHGFNVS